MKKMKKPKAADYTYQFKENAVKLATTTGRSVHGVSRDWCAILEAAQLDKRKARKTREELGNRRAD